MAVFDPEKVIVLVNDYRLTEFEGGADCLSAKRNVDSGQLVMAGATGVFIRNTDKSGTLTIKLKQHSADNKFLNDLLVSQENLKTFTPLTVKIQDLLNEDQVTATKGFFTTNPEYTRGGGHNPNSWVIVFEQMNIKLEKGLGN